MPPYYEGRPGHPLPGPGKVGRLWHAYGGGNSETCAQVHNYDASSEQAPPLGALWNGIAQEVFETVENRDGIPGHKAYFTCQSCTHSYDQDIYVFLPDVRVQCVVNSAGITSQTPPRAQVLAYWTYAGEIFEAD